MKLKKILVSLSVVALLSLSIIGSCYARDVDLGPIRPKTSPTNSYVYTNNF